MTIDVDPNPDPSPPQCCGEETNVTNGINEGNDNFITRWKYECEQCGNKYIDPRP